MLELNRESISSKVMCTNQFHGSMHGLLNTNVPLCQFCAFVFGCKISCFEVEFMKTLLCEEQCFEFAPTFANQLTFLSTTFRNISPLTYTRYHCIKFPSKYFSEAIKRKYRQCHLLCFENFHPDLIFVIFSTQLYFLGSIFPD